MQPGGDEHASKDGTSILLLCLMNNTLLLVLFSFCIVGSELRLVWVVIFFLEFIRNEDSVSVESLNVFISSIFLFCFDCCGVEVIDEDRLLFVLGRIVLPFNRCGL